MSSSAAGKFQDHYIVLGVETNADSETIQGAYTRLSQKYHADSKMADKIKFDAVNQAFEVLSDVELRAAFDKVKGVDHEAGNPKFTGLAFFDALELGAGLRSAVLCVLYDRMRVKSFKPSLSMRNLEGMLLGTPEELNFALWYLKKRGFVANDDKSALSITVDGMDFLEQNQPTASVVLQFIKADSVLNAGPPPAAAPPKVEEPVMNVLSRAIQRNHETEEARPRVALRFSESKKAGAEASAKSGQANARP